MVASFVDYSLCRTVIEYILTDADIETCDIEPSHVRDARRFVPYRFRNPAFLKRVRVMYLGLALGHCYSVGIRC